MTTTSSPTTGEPLDTAALILADHLDAALPPDSRALPESDAAIDPLVAAAVRLARGPHPVMEAGVKAAILVHVEDHARILAQGRSTLAARAARRAWCAGRWLAAASVIVVLGLALALAALRADAPSRPSSVARVNTAPPGGDTVVFVAQPDQANEPVIILAR